MVNRRKFVTAAAATVVAAAVPALATPARSRRRTRSARALTAKWWRRQLNAQVELQGDQWHLVEIADVRESNVSAEVEQFTISFRGSPGEQVSEGTYQVKVRGRRVKLHIQPAGSDDNGNYCVAAVSRLF